MPLSTRKVNTVYNIPMILSHDNALKTLIIEADRCVACGLCLPHCPTYRKTGSEADSPRGRIQLMRAVAQNILPNNDRFKHHIDLCLSCRSCESACPNSVNYGELADTTRALFIEKKSLWFTVAKPFIRYRFLTQLVTWPLWLIQKCRMQELLQRIIAVAKRLPPIQKPTLWKPVYPTHSNKKGNVSLFLGCASNALDSHTLKASIYLLNQLGFDVHIPPKQTCCGSIARQMGDTQEASKLVTINQSSFVENMPLLSVASGCGAGLNDYMPQHKILDISAFLLTCDWNHLKIEPLNERIHIQDPCTLRNVHKSHQTVYSLLKKIPHAEIIPLAGNSRCCGGAGAYVLTQTEMANDLLNDKLSAIQSNNVVTLATSNIGCSLHIANGIRERHLNIKILHPIQIMAQQIGWTGDI